MRHRRRGTETTHHKREVEGRFAHGHIKCGRVMPQLPHGSGRNHRREAHAGAQEDEGVSLCADLR